MKSPSPSPGGVPGLAERFYPKTAARDLAKSPQGRDSICQALGHGQGTGAAGELTTKTDGKLI